MDKPLISIIVPIYNVEAYLDRCIQSLVNQTLKKIEIILVDDESPDNCPKMCDSYVNQDPRIKVIHKKNGGLGLARNSGLELATGEYVAFVDSDDYVDLEMYENLYNIAKRHNLDTVFSNFKIQNGKEIRVIQQQKEFQIFKGEEIVNNLLLNMIASDVSIKKERLIDMSVWRAIYSRDIISQYNILFESERLFISEDIIFLIDYCSHAQTIGLIPQAYYYYTVNLSSLTKKVRTDRFKMSKILHEEIIRRGLANGLSQDVIQRADRFFIGYARSNIRNLCKSNLSYIKKRETILEICKDKYWEKIDNRYPIKKMPFTHRIFLLCIKKHLFIVLYILSNLK